MSSLSRQKEARRRRTERNRTAALYSIIAAVTVVLHCSASLCPTPQHTSSLTGLQWLRELLSGHPLRFYNMFGMHKHVFRHLVAERLCGIATVLSTTYLLVETNRGIGASGDPTSSSVDLCTTLTLRSDSACRKPVERTHIDCRNKSYMPTTSIFPRALPGTL
ncbi:hypothetical protein M378DRAFT_165106 [Amanita muscaria Koide BX008]|uniref:DUF8040 domain-containing protein n=1 Tax=Amanita muscaria (strain Koide BX008) TaxID=946122 RepID=A0A0C2SIM4_AMAMK|nr:hypothetical protein M378DRAFT_165106 [Amanita muscaria Koide BX008]